MQQILLTYKALEVYDQYVYSCMECDSRQFDKLALFNAYLSLLNYSEIQFNNEILRIIDSNWSDRWTSSLLN